VSLRDDLSKRDALNLSALIAYRLGYSTLGIRSRERTDLREVEQALSRSPISPGSAGARRGSPA
jgi:hypothetical protein